MQRVIIKKVEGRWVVDSHFNYTLENPADGIYEDGAYLKIEIAKITPIRQHPDDPAIEQ